jgi:hypothetical protein
MENISDIVPRSAKPTSETQISSATVVSISHVYDYILTSPSSCCSSIACPSLLVEEGYADADEAAEADAAAEEPLTVDAYCGSKLMNYQCDTGINVTTTVIVC